MKTALGIKAPYGKGAFSRVRHVRYLTWQDAFDIEFVDGICFLEEHSRIRNANHISSKARPVRVDTDEELGSHFKITYDTGEIAEVSWSFVRELPPDISSC